MNHSFCHLKAIVFLSQIYPVNADMYCKYLCCLYQGKLSEGGVA